MESETFCHENSPLYREARDAVRLLARLARSQSGWANGDVRRHASRLLGHATAAGDAPSVALRTQALRYAKLSALKLCAAIEVGYLEEQLSEEAYRVARGCIRRVLEELCLCLPPEKGPDEPTEPAVSSDAAEARAQRTTPLIDEVAVENVPSTLARLETIPAIGTG
jgi:hypothetical protein